MEAQTSFPA
jgi:hypothetical protein